MLILIGPSASGKTEVVKMLISKYNMKKFVTYTSRPMRPGEIEDVDYHFLSREEFEKKINDSFFLEYVEYNNNYYGTAYEDISKNKVLIVEPNGANVYYEKLKDQIYIVYLNASDEERKRRMIERGDSLENINKRLLSDIQYFDLNNFKKVNFVLETEGKTIEEVANIIYKSYKEIFR